MKVSVGRALPGYEIKMGHDSVTQLENGQKAEELLVRGPQLMVGYVGNAEASRNAFTEDGWLRTGDIGYIDNCGKVFIVERKKDLIKVNGWQVSPGELEDALLILSDIADSGVIGVGDSVNEHPVAFVVRSASNFDLEAEAVKAHLFTQLAGYKVRSCEILFINEIPRSMTGKILRDQLLVDHVFPNQFGINRFLAAAWRKRFFVICSAYETLFSTINAISMFALNLHHGGALTSSMADATVIEGRAWSASWSEVVVNEWATTVSATTGTEYIV